MCYKTPSFCFFILSEIHLCAIILFNSSGEREWHVLHSHIYIVLQLRSCVGLAHSRGRIACATDKARLLSRVDSRIVAPALVYRAEATAGVTDSRCAGLKRSTPVVDSLLTSLSAHELPRSPNVNCDREERERAHLRRCTFKVRSY